MSYALAIRRCDECHGEFDPTTPKSRFCSRGCYVENMRRTSSRGPKPVRFCVECGDPFKQYGPRQRRCMKPSCHWQDHEERVLQPWRESQERAAIAAACRLKRKRIVRLLRGKESFGSEAWKEAEERKTCAEVEQAKENEELAELIAAQEKDARFGTRTWGVSLDQIVGEDARLGDFVADPRATNPEEAALASELREVISAFDVEQASDVDALDENTLEHLRYTLAEQGLVAIRTTEPERAKARPQRAVKHYRHVTTVDRILEVVETYDLDLDDGMSPVAIGENCDTERHNRGQFYEQRKRVREVERRRKRQAA